ncbi:hypothetical protein FOCC_FOCC013618 [Frankliniella occidentalis]|nr:hypothetical protein FOCC_FOCC013618 [Frankliniella occidentalis]
MLRISTEFMSTDPCDWETQPSYQAGLETVRAVVVINDVAERAVALVKNYNCGVTNNESQFQNLLLFMTVKVTLYNG